MTLVLTFTCLLDPALTVEDNLNVDANDGVWSQCDIANVKKPLIRYSDCQSPIAQFEHDFPGARARQKSDWCWLKHSNSHPGEEQR